MLRLARLIVSGALLVSGATADAVAQTLGPADPILVTAKFDAEGFTQFLVPVRVGDATFWCNLDSGGSWVFSMDTAKALKAGLRPNATGSSAGAGADVQRDERVRGVTAELGSVVLRDITIVLGPRPTVAPDIDCVLGLALLQDYVVEFDYRTPRLRIFDPKTFRPSAAAVAVPFDIDRFRNPYLKARLTLRKGDEIDAKLILDTGGGYYAAVLVDRFIEANDIGNRVAQVVSRVSHTPNLALAAARFAGMKVGPFEVAGPVSALLQTPSAGIIHDGVVGAGFFTRFTVTFDYARKQMWLEPNGRLDERQLFDASGVDILPLGDGGYVVHAVAPRSPGAAAELRPGDRLLGIGDRDAEDLTLAEIKALLSRSGTTCRVRINRNGAVRTAMLLLKERL